MLPAKGNCWQNAQPKALALLLETFDEPQNSIIYAFEVVIWRVPNKLLVLWDRS